jgi:hypothetical protein
LGTLPEGREEESGGKNENPVLSRQGSGVTLMKPGMICSLPSPAMPLTVEFGIVDRGILSLDQFLDHDVLLHKSSEKEAVLINKRRSSLVFLYPPPSELGGK